MAKSVKIFLVLALLISAAGFFMCAVSAQRAGLSLPELAEKVKDNMKRLNMSSMLPEYSEIRETLTIEPGRKARQVIITSSFPDLSIRPGGEFRVSLYGDASTELGDLLSWKESGTAVHLNIASVFNESPSSTGLYAEIVIPEQIMQDLKVTTVSGSVDLTGLKITKLDAASKSGSISIAGSSLDKALVRTESGGIRLSESTLALDAESRSGQIELNGQGFSGKARTGSGMIRADFADLADDLELSTGSGNLEIDFRGTDLAYELSAPSGWVVMRHGDHIHEKKGRLGKGTRHLKAGSDSGSITFRFEGADEEDI